MDKSSFEKDFHFSNLQMIVDNVDNIFNFSVLDMKHTKY